MDNPYFWKYLDRVKSTFSLVSSKVQDTDEISRATPSCLSCGDMTRPRDEDGGCFRQHRLLCSGNEPDVSLLPSPATHPSACGEGESFISNPRSSRDPLLVLSLFSSHHALMTCPRSELNASYCPPLALAQPFYLQIRLYIFTIS